MNFNKDRPNELDTVSHESKMTQCLVVHDNI